MSQNDNDSLESPQTWLVPLEQDPDIVDRASFDSQASTSPMLPTESGDDEASDGSIDTVREAKRINLKLDLCLLPLLSLLYLFNGLDRGNIGNAQTQGNVAQDVKVCGLR